jgi:disulfide bond formation protein DsbB
MNCPIHKALSLLTPRNIHISLITIAVTALGTAYTAEYGFHILPCDFCLYERFIYMGMLVVGILSLKTKVLKSQRGIFVQLFILSLGMALTFYHVGMEQHWWAGPASCTGVAPAATLEEFRAQLMKVTRPRCDQISWAIFGISATLWNLMLQAGLAFLTSLSLYLPCGQLPTTSQAGTK